MSTSGGSVGGPAAVTGVPAERAAATPADPFAGPGEMRARCRAFDWAATPLGPADAWPPHLRTAADLVLAGGFATVLHYGPEAIQLYNDACAPSLGPRHPEALGRYSEGLAPLVTAAAPFLGHRPDDPERLVARLGELEALLLARLGGGHAPKASASQPPTTAPSTSPTTPWTGALLHEV